MCTSITVKNNSNFLTQRLANKRLTSNRIDAKAHSIFVGNCLNDLIKHYMQPLQRLGPKMHVEPRHVSAIFQNLTVLQQFHSIFLDDLRKNTNTAAVFVQFADFLKMYTQYVAGYEKSIATINSLRQNKAFQKLMEDTRDQLKGRGIMTSAEQSHTTSHAPYPIHSITQPTDCMTLLLTHMVRCCCVAAQLPHHACAAHPSLRAVAA